MATYHITNWTQLQAMSGSNTYILDNNLDKNTSDYVGKGDKWTIITGTFSGIFDGNNRGW